MGLHRLLREEEAVTDLAVDEAVRDELEDLDLAGRRCLLELAERTLEGDNLGLALTVRPAGCDLVETARVADVTAQDLLPLGGVHGAIIGGPVRRL